MARATSLKKEMYDALQAIPERLAMLRGLRELDWNSAGLLRACDSVLVAIFKVMERIIDELSRNLASKRYDGSGDKIKTNKLLQKKSCYFQSREPNMLRTSVTPWRVSRMICLHCYTI